MTIQEIATYNNLLLAWRRITTGRNQLYKRYFRNLYYSYEIGLKRNLTDLRVRLKGGSFEPQEVARIYVPKPSGLHRPITLLSLEDQIVLQAVANIFAKKVRKNRLPLQQHFVFSNILEKPGSIFFLHDWRATYARFQKQIEKHFNAGLHWVADFDLAAFYDTISHELLLRAACPRLQPATDIAVVLGWLKTWGSVKRSAAYTHGIPQGPIASDFLAECFLLPIDRALAVDTAYVRYVDDIRVFGKSEDDVRLAVMKLEMLCRERGLIPQGGKFAIRRATSLKDAMGMLPSIGAPTDSGQRPRLTNARAIKLFRAALSGRKQAITDKTRARFVLFRANPSPTLLTYVLRLLPRHPEHTDAFMHFLGQYSGRTRILRTLVHLLNSSPYEYVKGEAWHLIAGDIDSAHISYPALRWQLLRDAVDDAREPRVGFALKWGALHFLLRAEKAGYGKYGEFLRFQQSALLQSMLVPIIPGERFRAAGDPLITHLLKRSAPEPALMMAEPLARYGRTLQDYGLSDKDIPTQAVNVLAVLGVLAIPSATVDPIGEIIARRYGIAKSQKWRQLLAAEYAHALALLVQADAVFLVGRSRWLLFQNSFNHTVFLALQAYFRAKNMPGVVTTIGKNGALVGFGVTLQKGNAFSTAYPKIADVFRDVNSQRNKLPMSHPYDKNTAAQNVHLGSQERNKFVNQLRSAYSEILHLP